MKPLLPESPLSSTTRVAHFSDGAPAETRAVSTFFADLCERPSAVRVCTGLSCALNGGPQLGARLAGSHETRAVSCLGHCDRSPSLLTADGRAYSGSDAQRWPDSSSAPASCRPHIRCAARRGIVTERIARESHASLTAARSAGVYEALRFALPRGADWVLAAVEASGQAGRGGAGFPTGRKWRTCLESGATPRYIVANGDEGDPGSFIDRVLLEDDPHAVLEGLALGAFAVGSREGIVFIRGEYPRAQAHMEQAIVEAREAGILGASVMGSGFAFDVRVVGGHGSYVCGEETALLNAIEGRRGEARVRPPYPSVAGLHGAPTVVNNIETLVNVPWIVLNGPDSYRRLGTASSPGTKAICLNRGFEKPGIVEIEFGCRLDHVIEVLGGGAAGGRRLSAVAIGGPMGTVLAQGEWNLPIDYPELHQRGIRLGHGGIVAIADTADPWDVLSNWLEFMAAESCGKCAPCGLGSQRALALGRRLRQSLAPETAVELGDLLAVIEKASLCGFGRGMPEPIRKVLALALRQRPTEAGGHRARTGGEWSGGAIP